MAMRPIDTSTAKIVYDWRSIIALNLSSTLAQVGQFGIPFVVLPVWLTLNGADITQLSLFASSLWLGQLPGLGFAPFLTQRYGAKRVVALALLSTALALCAIAHSPSTLLLPAGLLAGWGQGLRWIGLEPWLYRIAPAHARGRLIGFHETLIALAPIVAPLLVALFGLEGSMPLWMGLVFTAAALPPLLWARESPGAAVPSGDLLGMASVRRSLAAEPVFLLGVLIAWVGGLSEAAFMGFFPVFSLAQGVDPGQIAGYLTSFGLGGLLFQYAAGWLADHRGMRFTSVCCCAGASLVAFALLLKLSPWEMHVAVFCLGGLLTAYLTLALIASAKTSSGNLARNMSVVSMVYTCSAVMGPLLAGAANQVLGAKGLMVVLAVFPLLMTAYLILYAPRTERH